MLFNTGGALKYLDAPSRPVIERLGHPFQEIAATQEARPALLPNPRCRARIFDCVWSSEAMPQRRHSTEWAASSAGRAPRSQCGGREFDPRAVHQPSLLSGEGCPPKPHSAKAGPIPANASYAQATFARCHAMVRQSPRSAVSFPTPPCTNCHVTVGQQMTRRRQRQRTVNVARLQNSYRWLRSGHFGTRADQTCTAPTPLKPSKNNRQTTGTMPVEWCAGCSLVRVPSMPASATDPSSSSISSTGHIDGLGRQVPVLRPRDGRDARACPCAARAGSRSSR